MIVVAVVTAALVVWFALAIGISLIARQLDLAQEHQLGKLELAVIALALPIHVILLVVAIAFVVITGC